MRFAREQQNPRHGGQAGTVRGHLYINKVAISFSHYTINLTPLEKYHARAGRILYLPAKMRR